MWWACSSGDEDDDVCVYCGGDGCEECEDQFELVQCRGITLRGTRCQITSDSASGFGKFADAAYPLTCGSYYCTFHTQQEWERDECDECPECDGEGCPECCLECDGQGCEECQPTDSEEYAAYYSQLRQQQQQHAPSWYAASFSQQRQAYQTPAAVPAAPSQDEVAIVGYRSRQERDAEARRHAIDLDSESETAPGKAEACAAEAKPASKLIAKPAKKLASKLTAKPAAKLIAKPLTEPAARSRPATRLAARSA